MTKNKVIMTYRGIAHKWLCDNMGHLNTRHYVAMFDDATFHFLSELGFKWSELNQTKKGWVDVKNVVEYKQEVAAGGLVVINSSINHIGNKSLVLYHEMLNAESHEVHATMEATLVCFDMNTKKAIPISDEFKEKNKVYLIT